MKKGFKFKEGSLVLRVAGNKSAKTRFAFIVSGKVSKKAVERNKIRRILSEAVRSRLPIIEKGTDAIFIVLPEAGGKTSDLGRTAENLLIKANLTLNPKP